MTNSCCFLEGEAPPAPIIEGLRPVRMAEGRLSLNEHRYGRTQVRAALDGLVG